MFLALFPVPLGVRNAKVFLASINKLLSQLLLEERVLSVDVARLGHVISILDLVLLGFEKPVEMVLECPFFLTAEDKEFWLWLVRAGFFFLNEIGLFFCFDLWRSGLCLLCLWFLL